ncbi:MAG TPA: class I SAM-dependent methyltransferase [Polyangiaceae bacterium]|nr:class I SAM-dependent methyltransferase [Polyangiaceae bacterium]
MHSAEALTELGRALQRRAYCFTTVTPATHARVLTRPADWAGSDESTRLREIFGWNRPFAPELLPSDLRELLLLTGFWVARGVLLQARIRFSTRGELLFAHSGFPTDEREAVFLGPDTYRFCAAIVRHCGNAERAVDIGCGTGAGGLSIAGRVGAIVLADINDQALAFARTNAQLAGAAVEIVKSDVLANVSGPLDLVVANPPYLLDPGARVYRDGGGAFGEALAVRIVRQSLERLSPGGRLLLYTGAVNVAGTDTFLAAVEPLLRDADARFSYEELDPDVFGEELERPHYARVERIAAVLLQVQQQTRPQ